uniref:Uncharacterized protein n=1 Tax=Phlebotomus papatasi TaxID=29031 RepID=A0A1B0D0Q4_PHLPP
MQVVQYDWFKALKYCEDRNLTLASIRSKEENMEVFEAFKSIISKEEAVWLGGYNFYNCKTRRDCVWRWTGDRSEITYTPWNKDQPDNTDDREYCLDMVPNGNFNDLDCYKPYYFMCENKCRCY